MKRSPTSQASSKHSHSKAFKEGLTALMGEIEPAVQWNRPGILLAVQAAGAGRIEAQHALENKIIKRGWKTVDIRVEGERPDVIRVMGETQRAEGTIFFVSGIGNADQASGGRVYRALNISRELLVENRICAVFWLGGSEAENLPRLAPDFWAFRHRVVDFTPKRGSRKQSLPAGIFLWKEYIPVLDADVQKSKFAYYENLLAQLPSDESAAASRLETILHLAQSSWLLTDLDKISFYLNEGFALLEKYPISTYQAWMLNARGIFLYEQGDKKDADGCFAQALLYDPNNGAIMMNAAIAAHGLGRNKNALLLGSRALKQEPCSEQLQRALGYLFFSMGKIEEAIAAMTNAQAIAPEDTAVHYALAIFHHGNGQPVECASELSKANAISPPQNILECACVDILNGRAEKALENLKQAVVSGEVPRRRLLRDPNLRILLDQRDFMMFD